MQVILTETEYNELKSKADGGASINLHEIKEAILSAYLAQVQLKVSGCGIFLDPPSEDRLKQMIVSQLKGARGRCLSEYPASATLRDFLK